MFNADILSPLMLDLKYDLISFKSNSYHRVISRCMYVLPRLKFGSRAIRSSHTPEGVTVSHCHTQCILMLNYNILVSCTVKEIYK